MKKGKVIMTVTIGLICFILTCVMFMQFRTIEETNIEELEAMTESELREKQASWKEKYEETSEKLNETNEKLSDYREKRESKEEASELLDKELLQAKTIAGETEVIGNGIIVTLRDTDDIQIGARDLVILINELKLAGAEAISINDQRIVNMSDIVNISMSDGAHFILVNQKKRVVSPYTIKAIGDQKYLESALTTKTVGFMDQYSDNAVLDKQNNIRIQKYTENIEIEYANINEEEN